VELGQTRPKCFELSEAVWDCQKFVRVPSTPMIADIALQTAVIVNAWMIRAGQSEFEMPLKHDHFPWAAYTFRHATLRLRIFHEARLH